MMRPGVTDPQMPSFVARSARTRHTLMAVIDEADARTAIAWAKTLIHAGTVEEYALGAITLEDAYIKLTAWVVGRRPGPWSRLSAQRCVLMPPLGQLRRRSDTPAAALASIGAPS
jgi:hypothetical protein